MTSPNEPAKHGHDFEPQDAVEAVLPMVGAALMFLLAFIAIYMA
jgi:hypothetical protein